MSLRDSLDLIRTVRPDAGTTPLEYEIQAERASSLGAAEQRVIKSLAALAAATGEAGAELGAARMAVWEYFVQRELCGFRRHNDVIRDLAIPTRVLNGLGVVPEPKYRR